jgi:hypothetical protein
VINELLNEINHGAKLNRYRITIPMVDNVAKRIDVTAQTASMPSKTITPTEVILRGRKVQVRGETNLENTWDLTFLNTDDMEVRQLFIDWMTVVHKNQWSINNGPLSQGISVLKNGINTVFQIFDNPLNVFNGGLITYQRDIIIEQLDANSNEVKFSTTLIGAFPINVSNIEYDSTSTEISSTTVTFAFSDIYTQSSKRSPLSDLNNIEQAFGGF